MIALRQIALDVSAHLSSKGYLLIDRGANVFSLCRPTRSITEPWCNSVFLRTVRREVIRELKERRSRRKTASRNADCTVNETTRSSSILDFRLRDCSPAGMSGDPLFWHALLLPGSGSCLLYGRPANGYHFYFDVGRAVRVGSLREKTKLGMVLLLTDQKGMRVGLESEIVPEK